MEAKEVAARKAVERVRDGMTLGLGTGTTTSFAIRAIGERIRQEGLNVRGVPSSNRSRQLAEEVGIPLIALADVEHLDLAIDGADEIDTALNLTKGGGGALVREKLVAAASREFIVIGDESKYRPTLGAFPLPVAVIPFGWSHTLERLREFTDTITLRLTPEGTPYLTDDGLYILDLHLGVIRDAAALERNLKHTVGVAETGLFVGMAHRVILGAADGQTQEYLPPHL